MDGTLLTPAPTPAERAPSRFDLSIGAEMLERGIRTRWPRFFVVWAVLQTLGILAGIRAGQLGGGLAESLAWALALGLPGYALLSWQAFAASKRPIRSLELDENGVAVGLRDGTVRRYGWTDPRLRLHLW